MITLNEVQVDWLTFTTFNAEIGAKWRGSLMANTERARLMTAKKIMQYQGENYSLDGGSVFYGTGQQKKRDHHMIRVTGALANEVLFGGSMSFLLDFAGSDKIIRQDIKWGEDFAYVRKTENTPEQSAILDKNFEQAVENAKRDWMDDRIACTRIDIQATVPMVEGSIALYWQQKLFNDLQAAGRTVSWIQDRDGLNAIATVGINKRVSPVYYRIYGKKFDGGVAMRLEVEYKQDKSRRVYAAIRKNGAERMIGILNYQMERLKVQRVSDLFGDVCEGGKGGNVRTVRDGIGNTEAWLLSVVIPSLRKVLNTSERADWVASAFVNALLDAGYAIDVDGGVIESVLTAGGKNDKMVSDSV